MSHKGQIYRFILIFWEWTVILSLANVPRSHEAWQISQKKQETRERRPEEWRLV